MKVTKRRPPVPGGPAIPGYGGDHGNGGAGGAKNLQWRFGCYLRRLDLATYNARTLRADEKILELDEDKDKLRWNVIGLSEVRKEGEDTVILESGNLFYHRECDYLSQGGVGFKRGVNAKLGTRENGELKVGNFGIGQRNPRGQQLADYMEKEGLFMMNSFFQKRPHRKWTWSSPDGSTKNEIDFIMTHNYSVMSQ